MKNIVPLKINGEKRELLIESNRTLLEVLREDLRLTGTKHGCDTGECGACSVLVDGEPYLACLTLAVDVENREVTTIEGLAHQNDFKDFQKTFIEMGALQCGYCTPGMVVVLKSLLNKKHKPTPQEIREIVSGNLCRCTGYKRIEQAVKEYIKKRGFQC